MAKKVLLSVVSLIIVYVIFNINYQVTNDEAVGKYANKNYDNSSCCVEAPHNPDTLTLNKNGSFESKYYGNGYYKIGNGFETIIELNPTDLGKEMHIKTYFENKLLGRPKIILNADLNHYYEKFE